MDVFQITLEVESHLIGRLVSKLVPSPLGPRQPGQFCAFAKLNEKVRIKSIEVKDFKLIMQCAVIEFIWRQNTKFQELIFPQNLNHTFKKNCAENTCSFNLHCSLIFFYKL